MAEKYDINKFIDRLCKNSCTYDIDMMVFKELESLEMGNKDEVNQNVWDEYCRDVNNISSYLKRGEFPEMKPSYKPLVDKLGE